MIPGLSGITNKERLDRLGLFFLEHRRLWGDLIEVYKIVSGIDRIVRRHSFKLQSLKEMCRSSFYFYIVGT